MRSKSSQPFSIQGLDENTYIKATLIKNSLYHVIGRNKPDRVIFYALINRIVLFIQKPVSLVMYDSDLLIDSVFRNLDFEYMFGNRELCSVFQDKIDRDGFEKHDHVGRPRLEKNRFKIFGTKYNLVFFIINYDKSGKIENTEFNPIDRDSLIGKGLRHILEDYDDKFCLQNFINISNVIYDDAKTSISASRILELRLGNELKNFPRGRKKPFEVKTPILTEKSQDDRDFISSIIDEIKEGPIRDAYLSIKGTPFSQKKGAGLDNYIVFIKTATDVRGEPSSDFYIIYTLRAVMCKEQENDIANYYQSILGGDSQCYWLAENGDCRIRGEGHHDNIGKCIFKNKDKEISVADFIRGIKKPFSSERYFLDSTLGGGVLGVADVCPDFSQCRRLSENKEEDCEDWSTEKNPMSFRHAATLCLAFQSIKYSENIRPKLIISPLVVNGVASMAISALSAEYTDNNHDDNDGNLSEWMLTYSRYIAAITKMMTHPIRTRLKELYLLNISKIIKESYSGSCDIVNKRFDDKNFINLANIGFLRLCHIYPMQIVRVASNKKEFGKNEVGELYIFEAGKGGYSEEDKIYFGLIDNMFFDRLFYYKYIKIDQVKEAIEIGIKQGGWLLHQNLIAMNNGAAQ